MEDKIRYFKMACAFCNFGFTDADIELLVSMYELVLEKGGQTNIEDLVKTRFYVLEKYKKIEMDKFTNEYDPTVKP